MKRIALIACTKRKSPTPGKARDMYTSPLFKLSLRYAAILKADQVFVLSAKHGLLGLDEVIEPYETTLKTMSTTQVRSWGDRVLGQLRERADLQNDHFIFLASQKYRMHLVPYVRFCDIPLEGLRQGEQLHFLKGQAAL